MERNDYINAFDSIAVGDDAIERLVRAAYPAGGTAAGGIRVRPRARILGAVLAAVLAATFGSTAIASKLATGSFVGFFADISGNARFADDAAVYVGQRQVFDNVALTLDTVVFDGLSIFCLLSVETADGSPLFAEGEGDDRARWTVFGQWTVDGEDFIISGDAERTDDRGEPSKATIVFRSDVADGFPEAAGERRSVLEIFNVTRIAWDEGKRESVDRKLAEGFWTFDFNLRDALSGVRYDLMYGAESYGLEISPLSLLFTVEENDAFAARLPADAFTEKRGAPATVTVVMTDGAERKAVLAGLTRTSRLPDGVEAISFHLDRPIAPQEVAALVIDGDTYPVTRQ